MVPVVFNKAGCKSVWLYRRLELLLAFLKCLIIVLGRQYQYIFGLFAAFIVDIGHCLFAFFSRSCLWLFTVSFSHFAFVSPGCSKYLRSAYFGVFFLFLLFIKKTQFVCLFVCSHLFFRVGCSTDMCRLLQ